LASNAGEPAEHHFFDPDAILVNITESDLNLAIQNAFESADGANLEGESTSESRSVSGLRYRARFSAPAIDLLSDGAISLSFGLEEAELSIESVERKIVGRRVRCENLGAMLAPDRSLDVRLDFRLDVNNGELGVVPLGASVPDAKGAFRLVKPSRCRNNIIPKWLLWWLGKPYLQRQFDNLDKMLLTRVRSKAEDLKQDEQGILNKRLRIRKGELFLRARTMDTSHDSVWVSLTGSDREGYTEEATHEDARLLAPSSSQSYLAVSEAMLNAVLDVAHVDWSRRASRPWGTTRKLFKSHTILTLVPGLRGIEDRDDLRLSFRFTEAPSIELESRPDVPEPSEHPGEAPPPRRPRGPVILLRLSGVEMEITRAGETPEVLGTLVIESGTVGAMPYPNPLGGISFDVVRNEWQVSSSGLRFNESLFAATIQELIFGELFETQYEPWAREALRVGRMSFQPVDFDGVDDYLVIGLGPVVEPAPTRTGSPLASR
jgi:hypothetical protein